MKIIRFAFAALLLTLINFNGIYSQTTGKISGKVTDDKGVPLGGATIKIENTNLGAASDEAGDYVILNVPVGTYSVRASYLGYETVVQTEVKVSVDLTTRLDFSLKETGGIKTEEIEVITKRNTLAPDQSGKIIEKEFIENTGIRGIENLASKTAGVVQDERGTSINIRGGRTNETQIIIDGVVTSNPLDGSSTAYVSNSVLQELAVLTGGFSAQYGNVLSGVINVTTKQGASNYTGGFEILTDQFTSNDNVKGPSQGYKLANLNFGGPLIPTKKLRNFASFYLGGERNDNLVSNPSWITPELGLPNDILPNYWFKRWSGNGKLRLDFASLNKKTPIQLLLGGLFSNTERLGFVQSYMLFNSHRNPLIKEDNMQFYGKINHQISSKVFYEVQATYFDTKYEEGDPEFMDDFFAYGDPNRIPELVTPRGV
ncbi:MAG: carboxypeptidase regulatory-like domain-containing protein, partial [Ignavibacteria bacterium]|nr:carboxypeptidase regulatory-like domain-containing protein [Ignavibacteria bacterium]